MKHRIYPRIVTVAVVVPLFFVFSVTPAHAILGSIAAIVQRATMILNQGVQIYNDTIAKLTFDGQLTQMINQASHLKEQALGAVGALTDPFTELASVPTKFIGIGLSWKDDFTGIPRGIASSVENMGENGKSFRESWAQRLADADTVSESDILALYQGGSPEGSERASRAYLAARQGGDKRLVLDHATSEVAKNLIDAAKDAVDSYKKLRDNTNVSNTALAQSQITGAVTQGHLSAAMAQLMAFQAAKEAAEGYESEITRREALSARVRNQQGADLTYNAHMQGLIASRQRMRDGMLFRIPALYGGTN